MKFIICVAIVFALASIASAQSPKNCSGGNCPNLVQVQSGCVGGRCYAPAPVIYQPRVVYQPYQYRGTTVTPKVYHTPIRNWLFGTARVQHIYAPYQGR